MRAASPLSRRTLLGAGAALAATGPAAAAPSPVRLRADGGERQLPSRLLGFNTPANNVIPFEDPAFAAPVKALGPHYLRFPGGTVANYYDWRTGQLNIQPGGPGREVRNLFARVAEASRSNHPQGVRWDQFHGFAEAVDADVIMLPNIETSSPQNEAARFADMASKGSVPRRIELGNEFYLALLMDPDTLKVFPDFPSSMARMKAHLDAIRPHLRKDALVAVQAASSRFHHPASRPPDDPRTIREQRWDDQLKPEPWFDAVTVHLYPTASGVVSLEAARDMAGNLDRIYPAMIARADDGFERTLSDTAGRMPGKEIWLTEWGGYDGNATFGGIRMSFTGAWLHQVTRAMLAQLRRREVTVSNYHALFVRGDMGSAFRRGPDGGYLRVNASNVLDWFFHAARGPDAHYQRIAAEGSERIVAHGNIPGEGFRDVEAALFRKGRARTLIAQNAWSAPRELDLGRLAGAAPLSAEVIATPDLMASLQDASPEPRPLAAAGGKLVAPAYSIVKATWTA
jgi:hypothetical protein